MQQETLFDLTADIDPHERSSCETLALPDAEVIYYPHLFSKVESDCYFEMLLKEIDWRHEKIRIYGRELLQPRLTAWYGEAESSYQYSGITMQPKPWQSVLLAIKTRIKTVSPARFNSVLLNLYRDGQDSVAWHADDEPELGKEPVIASISFGATRSFQLKHKFNKSLPPVKLDLRPGSLLLMQGKTQACWKHQIPKTAKSVGPRINLTYRFIF